MTAQRMLIPVEIPGPAGRLSGLLHRPEGEIRFVAVVSHPHPLFGGTMDNKVVYRVARALETCGGLVLRYDYRGVRSSEGAFDRGIGEQDDARAVLAFARARAEELEPAAAPRATLLAGFSFGSVVSSRVAVSDPGVAGALLVGAPVLTHRFEELRSRSPELRLACIQGDSDEHGPIGVLREIWETLADPKELAVIEGAGHFFDDQQQDLFDATERLARGFFELG